MPISTVSTWIFINPSVYKRVHIKMIPLSEVQLQGPLVHKVTNQDIVMFKKE